MRILVACLSLLSSPIFAIDYVSTSEQRSAFGKSNLAHPFQIEAFQETIVFYGVGWEKDNLVFTVSHAIPIGAKTNFTLPTFWRCEDRDLLVLGTDSPSWESNAVSTNENIYILSLDKDKTLI